MSEGFQDSPKQRELMDLVLMAAGAGAFVSQQELHARVSYGASVSIQAIQCSMRFLERHGMVERERRGRERVYVPTRAAYHRYRGLT